MVVLGNVPPPERSGRPLSRYPRHANPRLPDSSKGDRGSARPRPTCRPTDRGQPMSDTTIDRMASTQAAYTAALFDSCGMVTMFEVSDRTYSFKLRVAVHHRDQRIVRWLLDTTGAGMIPPMRLDHSYEWRLRMPEIPEFLREILPFVVLKRRHVVAALEYLDGYERSQGGISPTAEQVQHRLRYLELLRVLNAEELRPVNEKAA